jgi:hypothetical protein
VHADAPARDLATLLKELRRLQIVPQPGETLEQLAQRAGDRYPSLAAPLAELVACHASRRFGRPSTENGQLPSHRRMQVALRELKRHCREAIRQPQESEP